MGEKLRRKEAVGEPHYLQFDSVATRSRNETIATDRSERGQYPKGMIQELQAERLRRINGSAVNTLRERYTSYRE